MKTIWILLFAGSTLASAAQNSGAQYISSDKSQSPDSSRSEYRDDPSRRSHEESYTLSGDRQTGNSSTQGSNENSMDHTRNDGGYSNTGSDSGMENGEYGAATNTDHTAGMPCEARMNWGACAGSLGLGALIGALITWLVTRRKNNHMGTTRMQG
ncbi:MAG: hypothetical protein U0T73_06130 [Chitinophagales bacterium]